MKRKLFIKDLELRFSFSPIAVTTQALGEEGSKVTTMALGEEGKSNRRIK